MEEVNKSTKSINEKFEEMKEDGMIKERQISELENEVKTLNEKLETMYKSLDRHEKYSMIIHAMKENKNQNTDEVIIKIFEKKNERKSINDIDRPHRLGKKHTRSRPLPVIIKFARFNVQNAI